MNSEQLELQALYQRHLQNLTALQQQRQLLLADNPFHKPILSQRQQLQQLQLNQQKKEMYVPNYNTQSLLYRKTPNNEQYQKFNYVTSQIDRKIAGQSMQAIWRTWKYENKYSQQDLYLHKIKKQSINIQFESQLTSSGKCQIDQIIQEARTSGKLLVKTIRQKYQKQSVQQRLSDLYSHISKLKKLEDQ